MLQYSHDNIINDVSERGDEIDRFPSSVAVLRLILSLNTLLYLKSIIKRF